MDSTHHQHHLGLEDAFRLDESSSFSPIGSSSIDPLDQSLSIDCFLDSSDGLDSHRSSPGSEIHSFHLQDYLMPQLTAYGLPTHQQASSSNSTTSQFLPYPNSTPLITLGRGKKKTRSLSQMSHNQVQEALTGLANLSAQTPYFEPQTIQEWSGACSLALSPAQPSPTDSTSALPPPTTLNPKRDWVDEVRDPSNQDWSTKNKLNLTVDTSFTRFDLSNINRLAPNDHLEPPSSSNSYCTVNSKCDDPSSYFEPGNPSIDTSSHSIGFPSQSTSNCSSNLLNWLKETNAQEANRLNPSSNFFDADLTLPTPSSATFSNIPTPTNPQFTTSGFNQSTLGDHPRFDSESNQALVVPPSIQSAAHPSSQFDQFYSSESLNLHSVRCDQEESIGYQFSSHLTKDSTPNLWGEGMDYFGAGSFQPAQSATTITTTTCPKITSQSMFDFSGAELPFQIQSNSAALAPKTFDLVGTFGHVMFNNPSEHSEPIGMGAFGAVKDSSIVSEPSASLPTHSPLAAMFPNQCNYDYQNDDRHHKRGLSSLESVWNQGLVHPRKRNSMVDGPDSQKENFNPFGVRGTGTPKTSSALKNPPYSHVKTTNRRKSNGIAGPRLKPGPKSRSTVVQHPPPSANLIGLTPTREASGIPKEILKCLYDTVAGGGSNPSPNSAYHDDQQLVESLGIQGLMTAAVGSTNSSGKRYVCKLEGCGRSFPRKTAIESHLQTHLEDKPFICHVKDCNAAFVRQHDLRRHEHIHSDSKAYSCLCGKGFARGDALMRHRQRGICIGSLIPRRC